MLASGGQVTFAQSSPHCFELLGVGKGQERGLGFLVFDQLHLDLGRVAPLPHEFRGLSRHRFLRIMKSADQRSGSGL